MKMSKEKEKKKRFTDRAYEFEDLHFRSPSTVTEKTAGDITYLFLILFIMQKQLQVVFFTVSFEKASAVTHYRLPRNERMPRDVFHTC